MSDIDPIINNLIEMVNARPPVGIKPRHVWIDQRKQEILEAVGRYAEANKLIPIEWIDELNELMNGKA